MKQLFFIFVLAVLCAGLMFAQSQTSETKREGSKVLLDADQVQVRNAQLALAQAHIVRLQAEGQVKDAESHLYQLIQQLKTRYACPDCELTTDLTWAQKPAAPKPGPAAPSQTPAPNEGSGQTKE